MASDISPTSRRSQISDFSCSFTRASGAIHAIIRESIRPRAAAATRSKATECSDDRPRGTGTHPLLRLRRRGEVRRRACGFQMAACCRTIQRLSATAPRMSLASASWLGSVRPGRIRSHIDDRPICTRERGWYRSCGHQLCTVYRSLNVRSPRSMSWCPKSFVYCPDRSQTFVYISTTHDTAKDTFSPRH